MVPTVKWWAILIPLLLASSVRGNTADFSAPLTRLIHTGWVEQATLKYGMIGSICAAQTFTGLTEGYHWTQHSNYGGSYIVNNCNYHTYDTLRRLSWFSAGWFGYANFRNNELGWVEKGKRLLGSALLARNCMEFAYKWQRYNNPFDYTPAHNEHAIVYFGIRNGGIVDLYIGTGNITTPLVDISCLILGMLLLND